MPSQGQQHSQWYDVNFCKEVRGDSDGYQQMILEYKSPFPFPQGGTDLPFMCQKFPVEAKLISLLISLTDFPPPAPPSYFAFLTTGQILLKSTPSINHLHRIPFSGSAFRESNLRQENSGVN